MDTEAVVLGTILKGKVNLRNVTSQLSPEMFGASNKTLADSIWECLDKFQAIDVNYIAQNAGLQPNQLYDYITVAPDLRQSSEEVIQNFYTDNIRKGLVGILTANTMNLSKGAKHGEVMAQITSDYENLIANASAEDKRSYYAIETIQEIERAMSSKFKLLGPSSGYTTIDDRLAGWQPSDLIYLAGRPAMGKTTMALCLAYNTAKAGGKVGIITLEMSPSQIEKKLFAAATGISYSDISRGNLTDDQFRKVYKAAEEIGDLPLYLENPPGNFEVILDLMYSMKESFGIELFIIDYMQLMSKEGYQNNRNGEIGYMSRRLKESAAKDRLDACILCLSQLNRESVTGSKGRPPSLHNLRDSGSLEQDADSVIFIHRPEYYNIETDEDGNSTEDVVHLIFEKNRHGETGQLELMKHPNFSFIYEAEKDANYPPEITTPYTDTDNVPF